MSINSNTIFLGSYPQNGDFLKKNRLNGLYLKKQMGKVYVLVNFF